MFKATIVTSTRTLYQGEAWSVFLPGSSGEFEVLELHKSILSRLRKGMIIIDWQRQIPITGGAVRMSGDELVAIVEDEPFPTS